MAANCVGHDGTAEGTFNHLSVEGALKCPRLKKIIKNIPRMLL